MDLRHSDQAILFIEKLLKHFANVSPKLIILNEEEKKKKKAAVALVLRIVPTIANISQKEEAKSVDELLQGLY
jgi:hypothetical protein